MRLLAILLFAATLSAQDRTVIESIAIEIPSGIPDRILVSETRLTAGNAYTADEIRQAVHRIRRLPFVYTATYRLEPGDAPGASRLVLTVAPSKRFNTTLDLMYQGEERFNFGIITPNAAYRTFLGASSFDVTLGAFSVTNGGGDFRNLTLQYSGYDLFGTRAAVQLALAKAVASDERPDLSPTVRIAVPLTQVQSIVGNYNSFRQENTFNFGIQDIPVTSSFERAIAELLWVYETTDDPLFTLRGTTLAAGPRAILIEAISPRVDGTIVSAIERDERQIGLTFNGQHFFPFGEKFALRAAADGFGARQRSETRVFDRESRSSTVETQLFFGAVRNFGPFFGPDESGGTPGRHRLEGGVAYRYRRASDDAGTFTEQDPGVTLAYVYRHPRFFFRLTGIYYGL